MAKHYTPKQRRARKAILAGAATAGVSGALVLAQGIDVGEMLVNLTSTNTVIGVGGLSNPNGDRVPNKLNGELVPNPLNYHGIDYPATYDLGGSRDAGVPTLHDAITKSPADGGFAGDNLTVIGYSEGTLVAEQERRDLQATAAAAAPDPSKLTFTQIASPFAGNGGIFARFPETPTFLIIDNMGPAEQTRYDTTYVTNEYDPYGDFPAYFNPLSLANSALAIEYAHPDTAYDPINPETTPLLGGAPHIEQHETDGRTVTDTYYLYENDNLPLLAPIRQAAAAANITPFVEPELGLVEPTLRVLVDAGYTDRTNTDPATPTPFSLITPPQNVIGAAAALPGAAQKGIENFLGGGQSITTLDTPSVERSSEPAASTPAPATLPKLPALPKLPTLPKLAPPKSDPSAVDPTVDAKKPSASTPSSPRHGLPNLGLLANAQLPKPTVLAGGGSTGTDRPSFGGGRPAGVISGALKNLGNLAGAVTDKKPAAATP